MRVVILLIVVMTLVGCATEPKNVVHYITRPCTENTPQRPTMSLDSYVWNGLDGFVAAAIADICRREAYEAQLLTALENCKRQ